MLCGARQRPPPADPVQARGGAARRPSARSPTKSACRSRRCRSISPACARRASSPSGARRRPLWYRIADPRGRDAARRRCIDSIARTERRAERIHHVPASHRSPPRRERLHRPKAPSWSTSARPTKTRASTSRARSMRRSPRLRASTARRRQGGDLPLPLRRPHRRQRRRASASAAGCEAYLLEGGLEAWKQRRAAGRGRPQPADRDHAPGPDRRRQPGRAG